VGFTLVLGALPVAYYTYRAYEAADVIYWLLRNFLINLL